MKRRGTYSIPEPVRGSRQSNTAGTDRERENLADDDPGTRTPRGGEEEDEDSNERNLSIDGGNIVRHGVAISSQVGFVETNSDTDDGDEELTDQHAQCTVDKNCATTESLNGVEGDWSGANIDQCKDKRDEENVLDRTSRLQEGGGVVEDKVDTSPGEVRYRVCHKIE